MAVSYRWNDVGAPTLSGSAGALIGVLDYALVTGAGWSKVYSGTNKAVYRAPAGNRLYLRVDDTGTTSARVRGFETMSNVDTGTGPFPTDGQVSGGLYWMKSSSANTTAREWVVVANDRFFAIWINTALDGASPQSSANAYCFGDFLSYQSPDPYGCIILGNTSASVSAVMSLLNTIASTSSGHYVARSYTGSGSSIDVGKSMENVTATAGHMGNDSLPTLPNASGARMLLSPIRINESGSVMRGVLPGLWAPLFASRVFSTPGNISGSGPLAGKTFFAGPILSTVAAVFLETSNTW